MVERLVAHRRGGLVAINLPGGAETQRRAAILGGDEQREGEVVAEELLAIEKVNVFGRQVVGIGADDLPGARQVDHFGNVDRGEGGVAGSKKVGDPADGILRKVDQPRTGKGLPDVRGDIRRQGERGGGGMFGHFDFLPEMLADARETFTQGGFADGGVGREAGGGPAGVIEAIAEATVLGRELHQRVGEGEALGTGPRGLGFVEHWNFGEFVGRMKREAALAAEILGGGDGDAAEPAGESVRIAQVGEAREGAKVGFLRGVERFGVVVENAVTGGVDGVLRLLDEFAEGGEIAGLGAADEGQERKHGITGKMRSRR
jgi:hypothetical protein